VPDTLVNYKNFDLYGFYPVEFFYLNNNLLVSGFDYKDPNNLMNHNDNLCLFNFNGNLKWKKSQDSSDFINVKIQNNEISYFTGFNFNKLKNKDTFCIVDSTGIPLFKKTFNFQRSPLYCHYFTDDNKKFKGVGVNYVSWQPNIFSFNSKLDPNDKFDEKPISLTKKYSWSYPFVFYANTNYSYIISSAYDTTKYQNYERTINLLKIDYFGHVVDSVYFKRIALDYSNTPILFNNHFYIMTREISITSYPGYWIYKLDTNLVIKDSFFVHVSESNIRFKFSPKGTLLFYGQRAFTSSGYIMETDTLGLELKVKDFHYKDKIYGDSIYTDLFISDIYFNTSTKYTAIATRGKLVQFTNTEFGGIFFGLDDNLNIIDIPRSNDNLTNREFQFGKIDFGERIIISNSTTKIFYYNLIEMGGKVVQYGQVSPSLTLSIDKSIYAQGIYLVRLWNEKSNETYKILFP
jgi:hypothetical protein